MTFRMLVLPSLHMNLRNEGSVFRNVGRHFPNDSAVPWKAGDFNYTSVRSLEIVLLTHFNRLWPKISLVYTFLMWFVELRNICFQIIISGDWVFCTEENLNVWYYGQKYQEVCQLRWRRPWDCMQDNTGSFERVSHFALANSVKFIILERTNGRNVIFWFSLSWRKKSWRNGGNPVWWKRRVD